MFDEEGNKYLDCINNVATGKCVLEMLSLSFIFVHSRFIVSNVVAPILFSLSISREISVSENMRKGRKTQRMFVYVITL
jgi:hypothetical protein